MIRILYVTWDAPEATYLESLFLPAFGALRAHGYAFDVLQFRWGSEAEAQAVARRCEEAGVGYRWAPIDRRFGAGGALRTALAGGGEVRAALTAFGSDWLMPRSLFAGLAVLAARSPLPLLFEADGLVADERAEFGGLGHGLRYRLLRAIERRLTRAALVTTVRTDAAAAVLQQRSGCPPERFFTVMNGRDPELFSPGTTDSRAAVRAMLGVAADELLMVHAGSIGPQYGLDRIAALHRGLAERGCRPRFLLLNRDPARAGAMLDGLGRDLAGQAIVRSAAAGEVPAQLAAADLGLAYRTDSLSMRGVAPLKLAEYLLCGVPAVGNLAAGPTRAAVEAGVLHDQERSADELAWFEQIPARRDELRRLAREVGIAHYAADRMIEAYRRALDGARSLGGS